MKARGAGKQFRKLVRSVQSVGNLAPQTHSVEPRDGTAQPFSLQIFENEVIGSDGRQGADAIAVACIANGRSD